MSTEYVCVGRASGSVILCCTCSQLKGALSSREREIASLRRQLDSAQEELSGVGRDREIALRENRRLQDDLATMTRENQVQSTVG